VRDETLALLRVALAPADVEPLDGALRISVNLNTRSAPL
jgi:hypothetical protein